MLCQGIRGRTEMMNTQARPSDTATRGMAPLQVALPPGIGQVVLVLQGGGALGAYQVGVYEALHEAGIEPDWVIGTSIGAINASIIAGNAPENRMEKLHEFWRRMDRGPLAETLADIPFWGQAMANA